MQARTVAVIGAGGAGRAIALAAARAGLRTILEDVLPETLERALAWIRAELGSRSADEQSAFALIETAHSFEEAAREADFLFDATPDEWELKIEMFTLFDKFARPQAPMLSVISTLSISDLASMTYRPELCAGLRFLAGDSARRRVEVVRSQRTAEKSIAEYREMAGRLGWDAAIVEEPRD